MSSFWGSKLSNSEKEAIEQFRNVTSTTQAVAQEYLKKHKWKVDTAVDDYFNKTGGSLATQKTKGNVDMYEKYKAIGIKEGGDASIDAIQGEGVVSFAKDLGFDVTDIMTMVICWKLRAKAGFMMPRDDLIGALSDLKLDGFSAIKGKVNSWKSELDNAATYKQFYNFCFEFSLQPPAKTIPCEVAIPTWKLLLDKKYKHIGLWLQFVEKSFGKAIPKDLWQQFYDFTQTINADFSNFDTDSAWPLVIDEFVEFAKTKVKK